MVREGPRVAVRSSRNSDWAPGYLSWSRSDNTASWGSHRGQGRDQDLSAGDLCIYLPPDAHNYNLPCSLINGNKTISENVWWGVLSLGSVPELTFIIITAVIIACNHHDIIHDSDIIRSPAKVCILLFWLRKDPEKCKCSLEFANCSYKSYLW